MLRTLIIVAALILVFLLVRSRLRLGKSTREHTTATEDVSTMVQCLSCKTYVPANEAVHEGELAFCCQQHLRDWNKKT